MLGRLKRNWHHLLFFSTLAAVALLAYVLVGIGFDPTWKESFKDFPPAIGALAGPFLGLCALMLGALYNAKITRDRDDRLREEEAKALASALASQFRRVSLTIENLLENYEKGQKGSDGMPIGLEKALNFWLPNQHVYKESVKTIGILGPYFSEKIVGIAEGSHSAILFFLHNIYNEDGTIVQDKQHSAFLRVWLKHTTELWQELRVRAGLPLDHNFSPKGRTDPADD